jgi:hypothetical protein
MDDVILTGLTVKDGRRVYHLDNPAHRQRYVKFLNPKQKAKFAKAFLREIIKRPAGGGAHFEGNSRLGDVGL